jgi:phosphatidylglycerophosphate synthase
MFDQQMRRVKDAAFAPIGRLFGRFSPLALTGVALLFGVGTAVFLFYQLYPWALLAWLLNRSFDALDGVVARQQARQSDFGGYLDTVADFLVYALVPVGLALGRPSAAGMILLPILLTSFYVNAASWMYLAAILEKRGAGAKARTEETTITMPAGLVGGTETILFFLTFILFPGWYPWLFGLMAALIGLTIIQRLYWAWRHIT